MLSWISTTPQRQTSTPRKVSRSPPLDVTLIEEDFERLPKTDYTYAFSGSYSPRKLGATYSKPNMSRPGLRKSYVFERSMVDKSELPDDAYSSAPYQDHEDLRPADLPSYTPSYANGPDNLNNSGRYTLEREAAELNNISDRSSTRSGTRYGLLWKTDSKGKRHRVDQRQSMPPRLPTAQRLQEADSHQESFIAQRPQPDIINSRHSLTERIAAHRPEPNLLTVPHLYEYQDDVSYVPPRLSQPESWMSVIIRMFLTIFTTTVSTVAGAAQLLLAKSSGLVLSAGSESHSFISKVLYWIWCIVQRACYAIMFISYLLVSVIKLAVVKIVRFFSAPLRLTSNFLYDLLEWNSPHDESNRSSHWLRSGKDRPEGEENMEESELFATERTDSDTQNIEEFHTKEAVVTRTTTVTEWITRTACLPLLAVRKPIEWYWTNIAGGDIEEDLPWLRSGRNRQRGSVLRRRRREKRVAHENAENEYETEAEEEEMEANHVEEWEQVEGLSLRASAVLYVFHSLFKFLLVIVSLPFLIVLGPLVRVGRGLFGRRREEEITWLRSGKSRRQSQRAARGRRSGRHAADMVISDSETEEEIATVEKERVTKEKRSLYSWITTIITTTVWTTTNFVTAPGRWVRNKLVGQDELDDSESYKLDEILRKKELQEETRRGSHSSESGYDSTADADREISDPEHTSVITSVCSYLLYILMLPLSVLLAPYRLLKSAVAYTSSKSESVDGAHSQEDETVSYVENSTTSELRQRRSGKKRVSVEIPEIIITDYEEKPGICSRFGSALLYVLSLVALPVTVPVNWMTSKWRGSSAGDGYVQEDTHKTTRSKRWSTYSRGETDISRKSYSERVSDAGRNLCGWLAWLLLLPFYIVAAPFIWTYHKVNDWYCSRSLNATSSRKATSVSYRQNLTEYMSSASRATGSWLWFILTLPFLLLAVPFVWLWRKVRSGFSSVQSGKVKSFMTSVKESTLAAAKTSGNWAWHMVTLPFYIVAAPFVWIWRKSTSWYSSSRAHQSRTNAYRGAKSSGSMCCSWLWFIITLPFLILFAPLMWVWKRVSADAFKDSVASGASSTKGFFARAASAAGNSLWTLLRGTWWLICLPFTLTSRGVETLASSDAVGAVTGLFYSDSRTRKRSGGAGLCCCWCLPLLLIPLLAWLLYPGAYEKSTNITSSTTTNNIVPIPPIVIPAGASERDDEQTKTLLAALNQQSARIAMILTDMKDKDGTIAALKSEMAGLQAAFVSGQAANSEAVAGVAADMKSRMAALQGEIDSQKTLLAALMAQVKDCCKNDTALALWVADLVRQEMAGFAGGGASGSSSSPEMKAWVQNGFLSKADADAEMAALASKIQAQILAQAEKDRAAIIAASTDAATIAATASATKSATAAATASATEAATAAATSSATLAATSAATDAATTAAIDKATSAATGAAILAATNAATDAATSAAILAATNAATSAATDAATSAATAAALGAATDSATDAATKAAVAAALLAVSKSADEASSKVSSDVTRIAAAAARAEYQEMKSKEDKSGIAAGASILGSFAGAGLSEERVRTMIKEALMLFAADRNNLPDYALESTGGSVLSTRCSETYHRQTAQLSLFGIPLYYSSNSPRTVIQPDVHPGQCWAFKGNQGFLVIQLAAMIKVEAFTLEHIPKSLSPNGNIDSAPRNFTVLGLENEKQKEGIVLGRYIYEESGEPMQYFIAQDQNLPPFHLVELRIESNWGNKQYTCLYRFRVHGKPV